MREEEGWSHLGKAQGALSLAYLVWSIESRREVLNERSDSNPEVSGHPHWAHR